jgi:hypothetical protein
VNVDAEVTEHPRTTLDAADPSTNKEVSMNPRAETRAQARVLILAAALLSFGLSFVLFFTGEERAAIFVGLWVPSILSLGAFIAPRPDGGVPTTRGGR